MLHCEKPGSNLLVLIPPNCYVWELRAGDEVCVQMRFHLGVHHALNEDEVGTVVADSQVSAHCRLQILWEVWQADDPQVAPVGIKEVPLSPQHILLPPLQLV